MRFALVSALALFAASTALANESDQAERRVPASDLANPDHLAWIIETAFQCEYVRPEAYLCTSGSASLILTSVFNERGRQYVEARCKGQQAAQTPVCAFRVQFHYSAFRKEAGRVTVFALLNDGALFPIGPRR